MPARYNASLKYPFARYTVYQQRTGTGLSQSEARKEYTRLRSILNKRIERINASSFAGQGISGRFPLGLPTIKDLEQGVATAYTASGKSRIYNINDLPYLLQEAAQAVTSKSGSLKGLKQQQSQRIATLRAKGFTFVDVSNIREFGEFMQRAYELGIDQVWYSNTTMTGEKKKYSQSVDEIRKAFEEYHKYGVM